MVKLDVLRVLKQKKLTKYWLWKQTDLSYQNFNNMVKNKTKSIKYKYIELFCELLECEPNDIFKFI